MSGTAKLKLTFLHFTQLSRFYTHDNKINVVFMTFFFSLYTILKCNRYYQSPLILTELFQHNLINVSYLTACYLYQFMMTLHFLNDVANGAESKHTNQKLRHDR